MALTEKRLNTIQTRLQELLHNEDVVANVVDIIVTTLNFDLEKHRKQSKECNARYMEKLREKAKQEGTSVYAIKFKRNQNIPS